MTSKSLGGNSATYSYRYGDKLYNITSSIPGEGSVTYNYGGDGKRRERTAGGVTTKYNWTQGIAVVNEENAGGTLTRTYVGHTLAHVDGSSPSTGDYEYYFHDHLGSTRRLRAHDKSSHGEYEYTPYGEGHTAKGDFVTRRYAKLDWDTTAQLHFAPFRYMGPRGGRWLTHDPLGTIGGPNRYAYVNNNPLTGTDELGLWNDLTHGRYADLDHGLDSPYFWPFSTWMHFRDLDAVEAELRAFVPVCDAWRFLRLMHMGQDYFSHYRQGYRWPLGHIWTTDPDNGLLHRKELRMMRTWTKRWEQKWIARCGCLPARGSGSPHPPLPTPTILDSGDFGFTDDVDGGLGGR